MAVAVQHATFRWLKGYSEGTFSAATFPQNSTVAPVLTSLLFPDPLFPIGAATTEADFDVVVSSGTISTPVSAAGDIDLTINPVVSAGYLFAAISGDIDLTINPLVSEADIYWQMSDLLSINTASVYASSSGAQFTLGVNTFIYPFTSYANVSASASITVVPTINYPSVPPAPPAEPAPLTEADMAQYGGTLIRPLMGKVIDAGTPVIVDGFPVDWTYTESVNPNGYGIFAVKVWRTKSNKVDVTWFRDAPVIVQDMTFADPFGAATAVINFPQCTGYDPPTGDTFFLKEYTNVDILWVPATLVASDKPVVNPMTNKMTLYLHEEDAIPIWEGFFESVEPSREGVTVQCKGALYQLDRYFAKPLNPVRPKLVENMIERYFDPKRRGLWTEALKIEFETGWKTYEAADYNRYEELGNGTRRFIPTGVNLDEDNIIIGSPGGEKYCAKIGQPWTGFTTRNTGSWERALTGYIQSQLAILYTETTDGDVLFKGDQWTITMDPYRKPIMYVRKKSKAPTVVAWYEQNGVESRITRDGAQNNNVVFGTGKAYAEAEWSTFAQPLGSWTTWEPLASQASPKVWFGDTWAARKDPDNPDVPSYDVLYDGYDAQNERDNDIPVSERFSQFPDGISLDDGQKISANWIERDRDPGWSGSITLSVDLRDPSNNIVSRYSLRDGDVILLKGFQEQNTEVIGTNKFHISQVTINPMDQTVSLTVDTKFRDLLTVEEAIARGRDSLSPLKSLQVGKKSVLVQDLALPWNPSKGSGCYPRGTRNFTKTTRYPYEVDTIANPPSSMFKNEYITGNGAMIHYEIPDKRSNPQRQTLEYALQPGVTLDECYYVPIYSGTDRMSERWCFYPVPLSQAGTINYSEFALYDKDGNLFPAEFHVSIWNLKPEYQDMPQFHPEIGGDASYPNAYGALWQGTSGNAFDPIRNNGTTWKDDDEGSYYVGSSDQQMIIGWGNFDRPCGYSPRMKEDADAQLTGKFTDSSTWAYDFSQWTDFQANKDKDLSLNTYSCWVAVHVEETTEKWLYVMGRFYRKVEI